MTDKDNITDGITRPSKAFPVIPTFLNRKRVVTGLLNDIGAEHPEYIVPINALICYPIMKWVLECRDSLSEEHDLCSIKTGLAETASRHGISLPDMWEGRSRCFTLYARIISIVDDALERVRTEVTGGKKMYKAFTDVHSSVMPDDPASLYFIKTHYPSAILSICGYCAHELTAVTEELNFLASEDFMRTLTVTPIPLTWSRTLLDKASVFSDEKDGLTASFLGRCVTLLSGCPKDGAEIHEIAGHISAGNGSQEFLMSSTKLSWNTLVRYRSEAYNSLAFLIFGYTVDELIFWLWQAQSEEAAL